MDESTLQDARGWIAAARRPDVRAGLEGVYTELAGRIAERDPACWGSGRCCAFEKHGHRLYVTGLEAAYTLVSGARKIQTADIDAALAAGGCPFQIAGSCSVHLIKPMGCRVYFCDKSAQLWQQELSEEMQRRIAALHDAHAIGYRYAEWRWLLGALVEAGAMNDGVASAVGPAGAGVDLDRSCMRTRSENAAPSGLTIRGKLPG